MKRILSVPWLIFILLLFPCSPLPAQEGRINFGNLKVLPGLTLQEVYDDNIYLGNGTDILGEREESDWITHFMPSLLLDYTLPERGNIKLGYMGDLAYYSNNNVNNWQTHIGLFDLNYQAPAGLILGLSNMYMNSEDPQTAENQYLLGIPNIKRWQDDLKTKLGYLFSERFKVLGYYNYFKQEYDRDIDFTQNYDSNEAGIGGEMRILPKTWVFVRFYVGEQDFTSQQGAVTDANDADYTWQRVNLGLAWDSGAKISGELNFGYEWRDFDNPVDSNGTPYDDKNSWIASTSLTYEATASTILGLSVIRALRVSGGDSDEYFIDTGIGLSLLQTLLAKLKLSVAVSYSTNDFNTPADNPLEDRADDNYKANLGLLYEIQPWLSAGIGYKYDKKDTNVLAREYSDNQFLVTLKAAY
ncbi:MAG: outer membrane beta-barrel protein [Pseudomonadota bacterium]